MEEKVYVLKDGEKLVLMANTKIEDKRYLLLCEENTSDIKLAYEQDKELVFIDKKDEDFSRILITLVDVYKQKEENK